VPAKKFSRGVVVFTKATMSEKLQLKSSQPPIKPMRSYADTWRQRWSGNLMLGLIAVILMLGLARC